MTFISTRLDIEAARTHLRALDPTTDKHIFLLTDDRSERPARTRIGTLDQLLAEFEAAQRDGYAVHVAVNRFAGQRRLISLVALVRAIWIELDGPLYVPLPIPPSLIVRTSPGRGHLYWLTDHHGAPSIDEARRTCRAAAERHGGDCNACDPARVLRLAGSLHQKGEPQRVEIVGGCGRRYRREVLRDAFPPMQPIQRRPPPPWIRNDDRYIAAALQGIVSDLASAQEGHRNPLLNKLAFRCGQLGLSPEEAAAALTSTALAIGLTPREIARTIHSGATAGAEARHGAR